jgi:hypothetical protein
VEARRSLDLEDMEVMAVVVEAQAGVLVLQVVETEASRFELYYWPLNDCTVASVYMATAEA